MKSQNRRRGHTSDLFDKRLVGTLALVAVLTWSNSAYPGSEGDSALQSIGLLTFETGAADRFAFYPNGEFQNSSSTNPPSPAGDPATMTEAVVDEPSPNTCELDQSAGPDDLFIMSQNGGANVGFRGDSIGVFSRGGGGNARGVKCARISGSEKLTLTLGPDFDLDDDGDLDVAVAKTHLDAEFKANGIGLFVASFAGNVTGRYFVRTGDSTATPPPPQSGPEWVEILCDATGTDSNNDSGPNDNCPIEFPFDNDTPDPVDDIPGALWDQLEMSVLAGEISFEGGGDYPASFDNRSEFELVKVDGILDCQGTFSTSDQSITGARLSNVGTTECPALVPFSLDATFSLDVAFTTEDEAFPIPRTLVSWRELVNFATCDQNSGEPCFELDLCEGTPVRACSGDLMTACAIDDDCINAGKGDSCVLTDYLPPDPPGNFDDLDLDEGLDGTQYSCLCDETVTPLGTAGRDGIDDGGFPNGDDTTTDQILVEQCVFVQGDVRYSRR
jgi:hypothetical protein